MKFLPFGNLDPLAAGARDPRWAVRRSIKESARGGFTLVETLLAIALSGALLTGILTFFYSVSQFWVQLQTDTAFQHHVRGVGLFLGDALAQAQGGAARTESGPPKGESQKGGKPSGKEATAPPTLSWERLPDAGSLDPFVLSFTLHRPSGFFKWKGVLPSSAIKVYLEKTEQTLTLAWSPLVCFPERKSDLYRSEISPFLKKISFAWYEAEDNRWNQADQPPQDLEEQKIPPLPDCMILEFEQDKNRATLRLPVRKALSGLPY